MLTIEQVFVPLDFSPSSRAALAMALSLGTEPPRLQLAHILEPWQPHVHAILFPYTALGEDAVEFEHEIAQETRAELERYFKLSSFPSRRFIAPPLIVHGSIKKTLPEEIHKNGPELIVMGAFGQGGILPESIGSTAARVLRTVVQPVVLVRNYERHPKPKRILVAIDLSAQSHQVLNAAFGLACTLDAHIEPLFVLPDPRLQDPNQLLRGHIRFSPHKALEHTRPKLEALFERAFSAMNVPFPQKGRAEHMRKKRHVVVGDVARSILTRAQEIDADLIAIGSRHTDSVDAHQLGQVAWSVARNTPIHTLLVPMQRQVDGLDSSE